MEVTSIAVDSTGASYVAGTVGSSNFPVVNGQSGSRRLFSGEDQPGRRRARLFDLSFFPIPSSVFGWTVRNFAIDSSGNIYFGGPFFSPPDGSSPPVVDLAPYNVYRWRPKLRCTSPN